MKFHVHFVRKEWYHLLIELILFGFVFTCIPCKDQSLLFFVAGTSTMKINNKADKLQPCQTPRFIENGSDIQPLLI